MVIKYILFFGLLFNLIFSSFLSAEEVSAPEPENTLKWLYVAGDCEASLDRFISRFSPLGPIKDLAKELQDEADEALTFLCSDSKMEECNFSVCKKYERKKDLYALKRYKKILKRKEQLFASITEKARDEDKSRKLAWKEFSIERGASKEASSEKSSFGFKNPASSTRGATGGTTKGAAKGKAGKSRGTEEALKEIQRMKNQNLQEKIKKLKLRNQSK